MTKRKKGPRRTAKLSTLDDFLTAEGKRDEFRSRGRQGGAGLADRRGDEGQQTLRFGRMPVCAALTADVTTVRQSARLLRYSMTPN
jgi:hypothetical protein